MTMAQEYNSKEIDTCNGDDLTIAMAYGNEDNEANVCVTFRDSTYDVASEKNRHRHEHSFLFTPELAVRFANDLLAFAQKGFVHNATEEQKRYNELKRICPF